MGRDSHTEGTTFLAGGGEMGERTRGFDWSKTPLGPVAEWPQSLKIAVRIMLDSRYAMWLGWGTDFTFFYNDAYARMPLGPKHPWALGRSAREVWSEIWGDIGSRAESVVRNGEATWDEGLLLFLERQGFPEETYHTFSYSPIPDDQGGVGGMLCVVTEDTERTIGERRLRTLRELAARTNEEARSAEEACQTAVRTLAENPHDLPFVLIYLLDAADGVARLAGVTGLPEGSPAAPLSLDLEDSGRGYPCWPLRLVRELGVTEVVTDLGQRFGPLPGGAWPEPRHQAVVLPVAKPGQTRPAGFVVAGISPRRPLDDGYRGFLDLLAGQVATAVANARAYEEERQRAEALAELDRAKTAFFSNVSHEFRTPLTLMLGPVEDILALPGEEALPVSRATLEAVHRNGLRLQRLVNALLDFSRIEAGRVRASYEPTDLAAFTADLASNFRSACEKAGLGLKVDCPPLPEPVFVDRVMWEKVVLNLLSNAFKFTFEGGLTVSLRLVQHAAELRVSDTGTGIPPEEMPRLFERFHRVENARGRTHEGSGIGLALVQELVRLHGGSITAESEIGKGTTFLVSVPLGSGHLPREQIGISHSPDLTATGASPFVEEALRWLPHEGDGGDDDPHSELPRYQEDLPDPAPTPQQSNGDRPRLLIADDNADMRRYLARLLAGQYTVEAVPDGAAALTAVRRQAPDLVLSDVMMPRLDGFGLLRELRADNRTAGVPVVLLSARAGEESRVEGLRAGADDYLVKPFGARELLARVGALLQINRLRRESEQAIRQGEERFRVLFETMTEGFSIDEILLDEAGRGCDLRYLEVNPAFERHTGLKRSDIQGRTMLELFSGVEPVWLERYCQVATTGVPAHFQAKFGPLERWFEVSAYRTGPSQIATVFFDITDRKRAEAATQFRSEQLRQLAEVATRLNAALDIASISGVVTEEVRTLIGSHQAVTSFTTDQNWGQAINTVSLSEKYATWRGYGEKPDGSGIYSLVCRSNKPLRMTQAELETHPAYKGFGQHATDHPPLRGWLAAPLVGRDGRNLGLIQLSDKCEGDFTEEDEAVVVQLAQMASVAIENARLVQDLRDTDRRKDEFLATLAHELRNPLAPLRNAVQILKLPRVDAATLGRSREMMERQVQHLVRLVDDLLDVSRVMRGKIVLRKEPVELASVVARAVETAQPLVEAQRHELAIDLPSESLLLDADPVRLAQVVGNLLTNAAKYTEPNGRIRLTARRDGDEAVLRLRDSGIGIAADMLPHVFDLFVQVDHAASRSQGGLGIGLTLVKNLVEMHRGRVEAHSPGLGKGSEFVVRLPLSAQGREEKGDQENGEPSETVPSSGHRLLVVDDNRDAAESLAMLLRLQGHEVRLAHDGPTALQMATDYLPEMVFLDIGMPGMDGYEVARRLRRLPGLENVRLAALTGWGQEEDRRRSKEAGFDHHLVKPPEPKALDEMLAALNLPIR